MLIASIFNVFTGPVEWGAFGLALLVLGWLVKAYLKPWLDTTLKKKMAEYVLLIADEVTDQLVAKYPENKFLDFLDRAVDKIIEITGVSQEVATRAAGASLARKGIKAKG